MNFINIIMAKRNNKKLNKQTNECEFVGKYLKKRERERFQGWLCAKSIVLYFINRT